MEVVLVFIVGLIWALSSLILGDVYTGRGIKSSFWTMFTLFVPGVSTLIILMILIFSKSRLGLADFCKELKKLFD